MAETTLADELYREAIERFTAHGIDVDGEGNGTVAEPRLYQLIRQSGSVTDRTFEITFPGPGAQAFAFTFG
jgi:Thioredoxin like C-terminal domain